MHANPIMAQACQLLDAAAGILEDLGFGNFKHQPTWIDGHGLYSFQQISGESRLLKLQRTDIDRQTPVIRTLRMVLQHAQRLADHPAAEFDHHAGALRFDNQHFGVDRQPLLRLQPHQGFVTQDYGAAIQGAALEGNNWLVGQREFLMENRQA